MKAASYASHLLKVGDPVVAMIEVDADGRDVRQYQFWKQIPANGTTGTVVSFERRTIVVAPGSPDFDRAELGIYTYDNIPIVQFDGMDRPIVVSSGYVAMIDQVEWERRVDAHRAARLLLGYRQARKAEFAEQNLVRMSAIPKDAFLAGDVVDVSKVFPGYSHGIVNRLSLECEAHFASEPPVRCFSYDVQLHSKGQSSGSTTLSHDDLVLVRRGLPWMHYVDGSSTFGSLEEKAEFLYSMCEADEMRNPASGMFRWSIEEARQALREGVVDYVRGGADSHVNHRVTAHRFVDREFAALYRESALGEAVAG
jgi:hypothetical protein